MHHDKFWQNTPLNAMTNDQWESLCDGCGKCCVLKLEDVDTSEVYYTDVACKLLDCTSARCQNYPERKHHVPDCVHLTPDNLGMLGWMPKSCSYRLIHEGGDLPDWHPLNTGDPQSTYNAGHSVAGRVIPEADIDEDDMPDHIFNWC